ncbi:MAG: flagellar biosynthesis anti-sigma factor FlgM [Roseburia sp.]|nr:flagellar biosynthesis anti-sigma factor FlgM [Roseburia sp.]MCM1242124.1 flagellar biosynthesis anti-sigma factor FlgM [Roseburia sp.]
MRIEAYNQVQQLYSNSRKAVKVPETSQGGRSDQIQISSIGKDFQTAKAAVYASSDVREDVIAPLKAEIASGTYFVSGESFAERMLQRYEESSSLYAQ